MQAFTRAEAQALWSRLVAGWASHLDPSGARTLLDGVPNGADAGGSYEGVTRMLWGLGGWLSQPRDPALTWRGALYDPVALTKRALVAGTDPGSSGYWGRAPRRGEYDQRTVEAAQIAFATWQSQTHVWDSLADKERENLVGWLETFGEPPGAWRSNWALFWLLNHAGRKALGVRYDQAVIDSVLAYLEGVYCGGGWYDDGPKRGVNHFDDYNLWVFGTHVLAWAQLDGHSQPERRDDLLGRVRENLMHLPYFFGADGAYTEYGRSLSYKFARLGAPLWAYKLGVWPHSPGLLRRLVGRHLRWYLDRGALRADGTLRQSLTAEGSVTVREPYIATGSPYWAMLAFAGLWTLPDDDPFWTAEEEPLPVEKGDFTRVLPEPGWVLVGTKADGAVQRFNARSTGYPAKYEKFLYATAAPFNVGLVNGTPSPDNMLCLTDGEVYGYRIKSLESAVGEPGWLRLRYQQSVGGGTHTVDTTLISRGPWHLRAHRVRLEPTSAPLGAVEGPSPLGFVAGALPQLECGKARRYERAGVDGRQVAILGVRGYDGSSRGAAWQGRHDLNSVYGDYVLPLLTVASLAPEHELVCLVATGDPATDLVAIAEAIESAEWLEDGTFRLVVADGTLEVPPLSESAQL